MAAVDPVYAAAAAAAPDAPPPAAAAEPSLWQSLQALLRELPGLLSDRVRLASLELRRAGVALAQIVALAVVAAILLITAWLALWVGIAGALVAAGLGWGWALLLVIALNLGAAWFAVARARSLLGLLGLPATVRHLTVKSPPPPPATPAPGGVPPPSAATADEYRREQSLVP